MTQTEIEQTQPNDDRGGAAREPLFVFVNRRRFGEADGVKPRMSGAEIAALVEVPRDNAVVRREDPPSNPEIGIDDVIEVHRGDRFLVTRKIVEGGSGARKS